MYTEMITYAIGTSPAIIAARTKSICAVISSLQYIICYTAPIQRKVRYEKSLVTNVLRKRQSTTQINCLYTA